jgi:4a-hydroxytetrahydrobiopterin dehydratase
MPEHSAERCLPRRGGAAALASDAITSLLKRLRGWEVINEHHLHKEYKVRDFSEGLAFVNRIGQLAGSEDHYPELNLERGKVVVQIHTHPVDGLTESDFALAAKIDRLPRCETKCLPPVSTSTETDRGSGGTTGPACGRPRSPSRG